MRKQLFVLAAALFAIANLSFAQGGINVEFSDVGVMLATDCQHVGGTDTLFALPAGTTVYIYQDINGNGYDSLDVRPEVCLEPNPDDCEGNTVNLNSLSLNWRDPEVAGAPGTFYALNTMISYGGRALNGINRFYCVVPLPDRTDSVLVSEVTPDIPENYSEYDFTQWTCQRAFNLQGCPAPAAPTNFVASDDSCHAVYMSWNYADQTADSFYISRDNTRIAVLPNLAPYVFVDDTSHWNSTPYTYAIRAHRTCDTQTAVSPAVTDLGRLNAPPRPTNVVASDTRCDTVRVTFNISTIAGVDSLRLLMDGAVVASKHSRTQPGADTLRLLNPPDGNMHSFNVVAWNAVCDTGQWSLPDNGQASLPPTQVTGVSATDDLCDRVTVTWTDVATETGYTIYRNAIQIGTVGANAVTYSDMSAVAGTTYAYTVAATNGCGTGTVSAADNGTRLVAPGIPGNVAASSNQCGPVTVTWTAATGDVDSYQILRDNTQIGTVPTGTLTYTDATPPAGPHSYRVRAHSDQCGDGTQSNAVNGRGWILPSAPTGLTVGNAVCDSVRLTWTAPTTGDVTNYAVYRDATQVGTVTTTQYRDYVTDHLMHSYTVLGHNEACGNGPQSSAVTAQSRILCLMTDMPDTVSHNHIVLVFLDHCSDVTTDSFFVSVSGGPYVFVRASTPVHSTDSVFIVNTNGSAAPNSHIRILSVAGTRVDTTISTPFVIRDINDAVDEHGNVIPKDFFLAQNYPNPFNPSTTINYGVPKEAEVTVQVFDVLGRLVTTLAQGTQTAGVHSVVWNCSECATGIYLIRMQAGDRTMINKMMLLK